MTASARMEIVKTLANFIGSLFIGVVLGFIWAKMKFNPYEVFITCIPALFSGSYNTLVLLEKGTTEKRKSSAFNVAMMSLGYIASLCLTFYVLQMTAH